MIGSLADYQSGLGRALAGEDTCPIDPGSAGFRFTLKVRRSWCEGRTMIAARAVLTLVPAKERRRLVDEYVAGGGGLEWFLATERKAVLAFLAARLPDPSHALTLCRMDQAIARARAGGARFVPHEIRGAWQRLSAGRYAALVRFHADPGVVMAALRGAVLPPVGPPDHAVLFAPGLPDLFRVATQAEAELWDRLPTEDARSALVERLLLEGAVTYAD